jgi:hypothetical protein
MVGLVLLKSGDEYDWVHVLMFGGLYFVAGALVEYLHDTCHDLALSLCIGLDKQEDLLILWLHLDRVFALLIK